MNTTPSPTAPTELEPVPPTPGTVTPGAPAPLVLESLVAAEVARQLAAARAEIDGAIAEVRERTVDNRAALVVFSGDLDKVLAAFVIATGAAAAGLETSLFFTFWGLSVLKKKGARRGRKSLKQRLFQIMSPSNTEGLGTSKMNYFGIGARMFRAMMKEREVSSLEEMIAMARDLGVRMVACGMSMDVMGVEHEELVEGVELAGVAAYLADAASARVALFI